MKRLMAIGLIVSLAQIATGEMVISEWMYNGNGTNGAGEFVEFTNTGTDPIDMTGWSFDDSSRTPGSVSLSGFGVVAPGQSVILTDETAADFATAWGLSGVTIIGGNTNNLSRNDEINLYDAGGNLIDRLTYGDEDYPGTVRAQYSSCNIPATNYYFTEAQTSWVLSATGDAYGSWLSTRSEAGSPGLVLVRTAADFDCDGDVDSIDRNIMLACRTGAIISYDTLPSGCTLTPDSEGYIAADFDRDGDVDQSDFGAFQACQSGSGIAASASCTCATDVAGGANITLNGNSITVVGSGVTVAGTTATITSAGTYTITGTLTDGQIAVNSISSGVVEMVLNGVNISNSTTAPIYVISADEAAIVLAANSTNYVSDPSTYVYASGEDEPNAAIFSKDRLTISGSGSLTVNGHYNDGITSKDELIISGGTIIVNTVDDGIRGKDYLQITGGTITVTSGGDGLKSDNADDTSLGYISINGGTIHVTSGGDAITAETNVTINGGSFNLTSGGGSSVTIDDTLSAKGIKGLVGVTIGGGTFTINSADDAIHSNGTITIQNSTPSFSITSAKDGIAADVTVNITGGTFNNITTAGGSNATIADTLSAKGIKGDVSVVISGGTFTLNCADDAVHSNANVTISGGTLNISTKDDGVHADADVLISGGTINITKSYEGIEGANITINNGEIHVVSSDDGINGAGGVDGSGSEPPPPPGQPPSGGGNYSLTINGGYIAVNATGDGIDVNGSIVMTGGTVIVHGPTANDNGPLDYDTSFNISGGFLVAAGSSGMAQAPSTTSTQRSVLLKYSSTKTAGTLVNIQKSGTNLLTFAPAKNYQSVVFSAPTLVSGSGYSVYRGGSCTGTLKDGLYTGGTYSGGTYSTAFTISNIVTTVNNVP